MILSQENSYKSRNALAKEDTPYSECGLTHLITGLKQNVKQGKTSYNPSINKPLPKVQDFRHRITNLKFLIIAESLSGFHFISHHGCFSIDELVISEHMTASRDLISIGGYVESVGTAPQQRINTHRRSNHHKHKKPMTDLLARR